MLVRNYGSYARADLFFGLQQPAPTTSKWCLLYRAAKAEQEPWVHLPPPAHDRAGYAFKGSVVPGAYNADGTLKEQCCGYLPNRKNKTV